MGGNFECKVDITITRTNISFTIDKVGGDISQRGDGGVGGEI